MGVMHTGCMCIYTMYIHVVDEIMFMWPLYVHSRIEKEPILQCFHTDKVTLDCENFSVSYRIGFPH